AAQGPGERHGLHERNGWVAAYRIVGGPAHEQALVAVREAQPAASKVRPSLEDAKDRPWGVDAQTEGTCRIHALTGPPLDLSERGQGKAHVGVQEEEHRSVRGPGPGTKLRAAASFGGENGRARRARHLHGRVLAAAVDDDDFVGD